LVSAAAAAAISAAGIVAAAAVSAAGEQQDEDDDQPETGIVTKAISTHKKTPFLPLRTAIRYAKRVSCAEMIPTVRPVGTHSGNPAV